LSAGPEALLDDASPLVRAMAVWALGRLVPARAAELAPGMLAGESDPNVKVEWTRLAPDRLEPA
jgi:epoxyqueuosine reductase